MTTSATRPDNNVSKMIAHTREADKAKGRVDSTAESPELACWSMNTSSKGSPSDIVRVQIRNRTELRRLLGKVADSIATWVDRLDPSQQHP